MEMVKYYEIMLFFIGRYLGNGASYRQFEKHFKEGTLLAFDDIN